MLKLLYLHQGKATHIIREGIVSPIFFGFDYHTHCNAAYFDDFQIPMAATGVHESRTNVVLVATIVTTVVAILLTCLRLYVRLFMIKLLDWDDLFNIIGMVSTVEAVTRSTQS